ncbi:MAG: hypothetical protein AAF990_09550 [Bacteroidota bacterium]
MKNKKEIKDELSSISPLLSKMKQEQEDPFRVPHNYFEQLPDDIMQRLKAEAAPEPVDTPSVSWIDRMLESLSALLQPRMAMAFASMVLVIVATFFFLRSPVEENPTAIAETQEEISDQEIAAYIEANIDEFDAELLFAESDFQDELQDNTLDLEAEELDKYLDDLIDDLDASELEQLL